MPGLHDSKVRHFHSKIVGVTYENSDGSDRQKHIQKCRPFETLVLDHEEDDLHDANAVRVYRQNGQQLGYLNAELAREIVLKAERGYRFVAFVKELTGGRKGQSVGSSLLILQAEPGANDRHVKNYLKDLIRHDPELEGANVQGGCSGRLLFPIAIIVIGVILYFYFSGRR